MTRLLLVLALLAAPAAVFAQEGGEGAPADAPADMPAKKKVPAKKKPKTYDYENSRFKSRELTEGEQRTYRFNAKGEPVQPKAKGKGKDKTADGKKKRSEPPEEKPVERGCSEEKPCTNPDEADAL